MKKHVLLAKMLILMIFFGVSSIGYSQVNYTEDWEVGTGLNGWISDAGTGGAFGRFTGATTCGGAGGSIRANQWEPGHVRPFRSPSLGTSNGALTTLTFDYKVANWSANTVGTPATSFTIDVQWATNAAGPWTSLGVINNTNHVVSGACAAGPGTYQFTPSNGEEVYVRFLCTRLAGDYFVNFDNVSVQELLPPCAGTPNAGTATISNATGCASTNFTLTASGVSAGPGISYQWLEASNSLGPWSPIAGATNPTFTTSTTQTMFYGLETTCSNSNEVNYTNMVSYTVVDCFNVPFTGDNAITTCSGILYDHGGPNGDYGNNANGFTVINPTPGNLIQLSGVSGGESCCDFIRIFEGVGIGGTQLWAGNPGGGTIPLTTSTTGSLTVQFTSDGSVVGSGFAINISCIPAPSCIVPSGLTSTNITLTTADHSWAASVSAPAGYEWAVTTSATPPANGTFTAGLTASSAGLLEGTQYFLHVRSDCGVDGFSDWVTSTFTTPITGATCGAAIVISPASLPYTTTDNTTDYGNNYAASDRPALTGAQIENGSGATGFITGNDVVYSFTPDATGCYIVEATGVATWTGLWVFQGCAPFTSTVGYHTASTAGTRTLAGLNLTQGETYYIVISTFPAPQTTAYTLNVSQCPPAPTCASNFVTTPTPGCDSSPILISWDAVPGATSYIVSLGTTPGGTQIANNQNIGNLTSVEFLDPSLNTTYYYTVTPTNISGNAVGCVEQSFTTGGQGCYCVPTNTNTGDRISAFSTSNALQNVSTASASNAAYEDYTSEVIVAAQGSTVNFTGTYVGGNAGLAIWIDFNNNFEFEASERVFVTAATSASWTNSFQVPVGQAPGTYRMRIRAQWATVAPPACGNIAWGQAEDYTFVVVSNQTTQLASNFCGATNVTMDMPLRAINVNAPAYRFRVTGPNNGGPGWVAGSFVHDSPNRAFKFAFIPGSLWGATYGVEVALSDGNGNFGPYGASCDVSLISNIPTTQLEAADCGATDVDPNTNLLAIKVTSSTGYRFQVNGPGVAANTVVEKTMGGGAMRKLKMNEVAGILQGEIYTVEVAVRDAAGNWGAYGTACNVTLFGTPELAINNDSEIFVDNKTMTVVEFGANASHNPFTTDFGLQVLNANDSETINVVIYDMSGKLIERHTVNAMDIEVAKFGSNLASGMYMIEVRQGSNQAVIRQVKN